MSKSAFLCSIEEYMLTRRYSLRTIESYLYWIKTFIIFHAKAHPDTLGREDVEAFLTYLAVKRKASSSTQALALNAVMFLYTKFLDKPIENMTEFRRSRRQAKLPVILTQEEVQRLLLCEHLRSVLIYFTTLLNRSHHVAVILITNSDCYLTE